MRSTNNDTQKKKATRAGVSPLRLHTSRPLMWNCILVRNFSEGESIEEFIHYANETLRGLPSVHRTVMLWYNDLRLCRARHY
jgi:hypothetical protein